MFRQDLLTGLDWALASLPTLPVGKGALILIIGGIFAATISLVWTVLMPREVPVRAMARQWPHAQRAKGQPRPRQVPVKQIDRRLNDHAPPRPPARRNRSSQGHKRRPRGLPAAIAWLGQVSMVAQQRGLGEVRPVAVWDDDHGRFQGTKCRSCQDRDASKGSEEKRRPIKDESGRHVAYAKVTELDCGAQTDQACMFDVRTGEARAP